MNQFKRFIELGFDGLEQVYPVNESILDIYMRSLLIIEQAHRFDNVDDMIYDCTSVVDVMQSEIGISMNSDYSEERFEMVMDACEHLLDHHVSDPNVTIIERLDL